MQGKSVADAAVVDRDPGVLADEVLLLLGHVHVLEDRLEHALARDRRLAPRRVGERVAQILRDVLQRPDVEVRRRVLDRQPRSVATALTATPPRTRAARRPRARPRRPPAHARSSGIPCGPSASRAAGCAASTARTTSTSPSIAAANTSMRAPRSSRKSAMSRRPMCAAAPRPVSQSPPPQSHEAFTAPAPPRAARARRRDRRAPARRTPPPSPGSSERRPVAHARPLRSRAPRAPAEHRALQERVAHHAVPPVRPARDLTAGVDALERRLRVLVDHEPAVLVVEDGVRVDLLGQRVDPATAVAPEHVRKRDLGVLLGDPRRVEPDRRATVRRRDTHAPLDLVHDRLRDRVARAERVRELLAVGVQEHGAVRARRLRDRVALHRRRPRAAVRVVLERVEVARFRAGVEGDARHLAGRVRVVRRELAERTRASAKQRPPAARITAAASTVAAPSFVSKLARQPPATGSSERRA